MDKGIKIRYIAGIYGVLVFLAMVGVYHICTVNDSFSRDMGYYNEKLRQAEEKIQKGTQRSRVEEQFGCAILFAADHDYKARLNGFLKKQAAVFDLEQDGEITGKAIWTDEERIYQQLRKKLLYRIETVCLLFLVGGLAVLLILYVNFTAPFRRLSIFAGEIAKGNFDFPLPMQKHNFFGVFTESFDLMREELKQAKEKEYEANRSKKELVAALSHDIKTPLATIKATCEVMELKEKKPQTLEKAGIIARKADMIDSLVENMFQASLEELEVLRVEAAEESSLSVPLMFDEMKFYGEIHFENEVPECLVYMDKLRLGQVIGNIVNNAFKYAGTSVSVSFLEKKDGIWVRIKDRGKGIPEEELAMLTEKYYRGSNTKGKPGSGLGLYLSKMFMEGMNGGMECFNDSCGNGSGFCAALFLRKI